MTSIYQERKKAISSFEFLNTCLSNFPQLFPLSHHRLFKDLSVYSYNSNILLLYNWGVTTNNSSILSQLFFPRKIPKNQYQTLKYPNSNFDFTKYIQTTISQLEEIKNVGNVFGKTTLLKFLLRKLFHHCLLIFQLQIN